MPDTLRPRLPARLTARLGATADGPPDAELLARHCAGVEGEAFALLVARHGPMVWAVCRRVLGNHADAEDAFQAAFLVLLRRAGDVRHRDRFTGWLYGVAYRTAVHARRVRAGRWRRESPGEELPEVADRAPTGDPELPGIVERELAALPEKYRVPVALCDLDGRSREEAARLLGIPEGTLSSRLHTARRLLAARLTRYASAGVAPLAACSAASASVPWPLVESTVRAATVGGSAAVSSLVSGVCRAMSVKSKLLACASVLGLLAGSLGLSLVSAGDPQPVAPKLVPVAAIPGGLPAEPRAEGEDKKVSDAPAVVVKTEPVAGAEAVDPGTKEIRVTFSKEMTDKSWSWATDTGRGADLPGDNVRYDKDKKTCIMDVKLKPETTYATWINVGKFLNFKDAGGTPSVPYLLVFRTGKAK